MKKLARREEEIMEMLWEKGPMFVKEMLLLCDEPTGALDYQTGKAILKLLQDTGRKTGMTVIIITHNSALTAMADRVIRVKNGTVVSVEVNPSPTDIAEIEW